MRRNFKLARFVLILLFDSTKVYMTRRNSHRSHISLQVLAIKVHMFTKVRLQIPIIFVAHSMGGLVVKKAYILGQNDDNYRDIVQSSRAILFLSTPHRGTNLAEALNRILAVSIFNHSAKQYIAELKQNSPTIHDINEQFRNIAPKLQIVSFFETQVTAVGPKKMMVLEKDSSILGYPGEISKPLDADHHNVCKYASQQDPNYISVRNVLKSLISRLRKPDFLPPDNSLGQDDGKLEKLLAISQAPDDDYEFFRDRWMPGSCEWITSNPTFTSWSVDDSYTPRFLWVNGLPGSGKSILSSFVIEHLKRLGKSCQFYFFKHGDQSKRSPNSLLRSLAYQIACDLPDYKVRLGKLADDALNVEKAEARVIWQRLFVSALFSLGLERPLFWVIDGLDECDAPQSLLSLLTVVSASNTPLRVMLIGRKNQSQYVAFGKLAQVYQVDRLSADTPGQDLRMYVAKEMEYMHGRPSFKENVISKILDRANGNWLWVHLVVREILDCHTEAAIDQALEEIPADLEPLYQRMEAGLVRTSRPADKGLAILILTCATCSQRSLSLEELSQVIQPEYSTVLDLKHTLSQVCGDFVIVDNKSRVTMVHQTAREYLTKTPDLQFFISPPTGHHKLFSKCLSFLLDNSSRLRGYRIISQPFMLYAATSWSYHLSRSAAFSDQVSIEMLATFFQGPCVLSWIYILALTGQLRILVYTSQTLNPFLEKKARSDAEKSPLTHRLREKEILEFWATDLVKIVGKFGAHLLAHPKSVYRLIPPFCPQNSAIYRQFGPKKSTSTLVVMGFSIRTWDDCLAKFSVGRDCQASKILCVDRYFAILRTDGTVILWHALTCEEARRFPHGERVLAMNFSSSQDLLVTYGFRTTKLWNISSSKQLHSFTNPIGAKALGIAFALNDTAIISCSDDKAIRRISLGAPEPQWEIAESVVRDETFAGKNYNSPRRVAFNPDGSLVAVSYRGFPLAVWGVDSPGLIARCERPSDRGRGRHDMWTDVGSMGWNPVTGHVLGLYNDGCIFKWHPFESEIEEIKTTAAEIQCSPDGNLFVTSNVDGTLKIWNFHHFAMIYQLSCTSPVTDLAMSPDGRRIYDLRGAFCNIWEPNVLIRLAETDEKGSETSSNMGSSTQVSLVSEVSAEMSEPITALAISPRTSSYCAGDDVGVLRLCRGSGHELEQMSQSFMPVDRIAWSHDEERLISADLSGRISVWSMHMENSNKPSQLLFEANAANDIQQLLINPTSNYFLTASNGSVNVRSLNTNTVLVTRPIPEGFHRWAAHPLNDDLVIRFDFDSLRVYRWTTLDEIQTSNLDRTSIDVEPNPRGQFEYHRRPSARYLAGAAEPHNFVDIILTTPDRSHMLIQTSRGLPHHRRKGKYMLLRTRDLERNASAKDTIKLTPIALPPPLIARMELPLGFMASDAGRAGAFAKGPVLAFLDTEYWVCTSSLTDGQSSDARIKRHFFLPRDWLNMECLDLAVMTKDGTFLCPKNGEVAVVRNGLSEEWVD